VDGTEDTYWGASRPISYCVEFGNEALGTIQGFAFLSKKVDEFVSCVIVDED
jgi:hypothetical protein